MTDPNTPSTAQRGTPETDAAIARVAKQWPARHHDDNVRNKLGYYLDLTFELQETCGTLERRALAAEADAEEGR